MKAKQRVVSIQVCRGLAAILVVLAHLHNVQLKYFGDDRLQLFQFGDLGVDLFFVISGVVISLVTAGKFQSSRYAWTFLYHRLARIYPIYWIYSALVLAAYLYNPIWVNASGGHHVHILQSFLLIPTNVPMLLLQGWTLTYEIYFYLVFFVLLLISPARLAPWLLAVWVATVLTLGFAIPHSQPVISVLVSPAILEFFAGCLLFQLYRRAFLHPSVGVVLVASSLLWLTGVILWTNHAHGADAVWIESSALIRAALYGSFSVLFLLGFMELERSRFISFALPFVAVGDWSYSIYLSHTIVLKFCSHYFAQLAPHSGLVVLLTCAISVAAVIGIGYLSFAFLERPLIGLLYSPTSRPRPLAQIRSSES